MIKVIVTVMLSNNGTPASPDNYLFDNIEISHEELSQIACERAREKYGDSTWESISVNQILVSGDGRC